MGILCKLIEINDLSDLHGQKTSQVIYLRWFTDGGDLQYISGQQPVHQSPEVVSIFFFRYVF